MWDTSTYSLLSDRMVSRLPVRIDISECMCSHMWCSQQVYAHVRGAWPHTLLPHSVTRLLSDMHSSPVMDQPANIQVGWTMLEPIHSSEWLPNEFAEQHNGAVHLSVEALINAHLLKIGWQSRNSMQHPHFPGKLCTTGALCVSTAPASSDFNHLYAPTSVAVPCSWWTSL